MDIETSVQDETNANLWSLARTKAELLRALLERDAWHRLYLLEKAESQRLRWDLEDRTPISLDD